MMDSTAKHPDDFGPYLDGDAGDRRYEEIRHHLDGCRKCREEIRIWHSLDDLFRNPEAQIEVPPFQWTRIEAQLEARKPGIMGRLNRLLQSRRLAWSAAFTLVLIAAVTFSGVGYRRHLEKRDFAALAVFNESETRRISEAENPFRALLGGAPDVNPFRRFQNTEDNNPFSIHH